MKRIVKVNFLLCCCLALSGCGVFDTIDQMENAGPQKFDYPVKGLEKRKVTESPFSEKILVVAPFKDSRPKPTTPNPGTLFWAYLPLAPFGYININSDDANISDFSDAASFSLKESGLFKKVIGPTAKNAEKADFTFEGELISTSYEGIIWTYGLSVYGYFFWILALPVGTIDEDLVIKFTLKNNKGKVIWSKEYQEDETKMISGFYYKISDENKFNNGAAYIMQLLMNDAIYRIQDLD